jgi:hypothetical protein
MTKAEIWKGYFPKARVDENPQAFKELWEAMDEYARQMAIGFAEWSFANYHRTINVDGGNDKGWHPRFMALDRKNDYTTAELYDLFITTQKQG